jgi:prepilin-type N-terminal cleavage/methylation domain-containing protein
MGRARPIGAAGFTLVEILMVLALAVVVTAIAIPVSRNMLSRSKATGANMEVVSWLEMARNRATAERRNYEVTFVPAQRLIQIQRVEADGTKSAPVQDRYLPETVAFVQFSGATDTPDAFGAAGPIVFSGSTPHMFTTDGSFIDSNGDPSNGTLFMGKPGQRDTGTAVTVFGATGLLRAWKLAGNKWIR